MKERKPPVDDLFRQGIEGHEESPPAFVWDGVARELDKKQASYYKGKYQRLRRAGLLLLLLCFIGGGYHLLSDRQQGRLATEPSAGRTTTPAFPGQPAAGDRNGTDAPAGDGAVNNATPGAVRRNTPTGQGDNATMVNAATNQAGRRTPGAAQNSMNGGAALSAQARAQDGAGAKSSIAQGINKAAVAKNGRSVQKAGFAENAGMPAEATAPRPAALAAASARMSFPLPQNERITSVRLQALSPQAMNIVAPLPLEKTAARRPGRFSLSVFAAPNFSFDRLEDDDRLAGPGRNRHEAHRDEQEKASFSLGLLVHYALSGRWELQSGFTYTSTSTMLAPKTVYARQAGGRTCYELPQASGYSYLSPKGSSQPAVGDSARTSGTVSRLRYLGIPAAVSYRLSTGRFSFRPSLGVGLNILAGGETSTRLSPSAGSESAATAAIDGLKPAYLDGQIGFGIEYGLSKKITVGLRPNARVAITPINTETPVRSYQDFLGLEAGLRVRL